MGDFPCRGPCTGHGSQGGHKCNSSSLSGRYLAKALIRECCSQRRKPALASRTAVLNLTHQFKELKHHVCATAAWLSKAHLHVLAKLQCGCMLPFSCTQDLRCTLVASITQVPRLSGLRQQQQAAPP